MHASVILHLGGTILIYHKSSQIKTELGITYSLAHMCPLCTGGHYAVFVGMLHLLHSVTNR